MGIRRKARELALQALFCMEMSGDASEEMFQRFCENYPPTIKSRPFFLQLVKGVNETQVSIDQLIERYSHNWRLKRMSCVDRNILRIAVYEMLFCDDIPFKVSINEAIDIGKKYGTEESGAFINGILDSIRFEKEREGTAIDAADHNESSE